VDPRKQAEQAADALLAAANSERVRAAEENTRALVRFYPDLARVPPLERFAALREAREAASQHVAAKFLMAVLALAVAALVAIILAGHAELARIPAWIVAGSAISSQLLQQVLVRRELRDK
jgi:hypothetical protein